MVIPVDVSNPISTDYSADRIKVLGQGKLSSKLAIVGEAPGKKELEKLTPFIGPSGYLLRSVLERLQNPPANCYLTNLMKCMPQAPNGRAYPAAMNYHCCWETKGKYVKTSEEFIYWQQQLADELQASEANVIVALGNVALYALTGRWGIHNLRGSQIEATLPGLEGRKVIPCLHPASALRVHKETFLILQDIAKACRHQHFPELTIPERNIQIGRHVDDLLTWAGIVGGRSPIAFDIETMKAGDSYEIQCFSLASSAGTIVIPLFEGGQNVFSPKDEIRIMEMLSVMLRHPILTILVQNLNFDALYMLQKYGITITNYHDTMIAQKILMPEMPKSLGFQCSLYTEEPYYKDEGKQWIYGKYAATSEHQFHLYNGKDSAVLLEIWPKLEAALKKQGNWETYLRQLSILPALFYMQIRGIKMDVEGLNTAADEALVEIEDLQLKLNAAVAERCPDWPGGLNANSSPQLQAYFYKRLKQTPFKKNKKDTADVDAMKRLIGKGFHEASLVLQIRQLIKLRSTYYKVKLREGRLTCSFDPVGTLFGRLSSSKSLWGYGANMQNQPHKLKYYMLPDEGYLIGEIDLSQAENRVVAWASLDKNKMQVFLNGQDVHSITASQMLKELLEDITPEKRKVGKICNHALGYRLGYKALSLKLESSEAVGKKRWKEWHEATPAVSKTYWPWIEEQLYENKRTITNPFDRNIRLFDRLDIHGAYKQAYSGYAQSTVADIINKRGLAYAMEESELEPVELLNQGHDSIVFQIPLAIGPEGILHCLKLLTVSLETEFQIRDQPISIPCDIKLSTKNLGAARDLTDLTIEALTECLEN